MEETTLSNILFASSIHDWVEGMAASSDTNELDMGGVTAEGNSSFARTIAVFGDDVEWIAISALSMRCSVNVGTLFGAILSTLMRMDFKEKNPQKKCYNKCWLKERLYIYN